MTPGSFDTATCRSIVGDGVARAIESRAREAAENGVPLVRSNSQARTYWEGVQEEAEWIVACAAYKARMARIERKRAAGAET